MHRAEFAARGGVTEPLAIEPGRHALGFGRTVCGVCRQREVVKVRKHSETNRVDCRSPLWRDVDDQVDIVEVATFIPSNSVAAAILPINVLLGAHINPPELFPELP